MAFNEPRIEFEAIEDDDIIRTSGGAGYDNCQNQGGNAMQQQEFCDAMQTPGMA